MAGLNGYTFYSPTIRAEYLRVLDEQTTWNLQNQPIIIQSEKVVQDSAILQKDIDYSINYQTGLLKLKKVLPVNTLLEVQYQIYPPFLLQKFYTYQVLNYSDSLKIKEIKSRNPFQSSGEKINLTGSKTISISIANNEDFDLKQSLFLKLDGELSADMKIEAQLSDSQSPITPEGDSRELSSLDQVFIRLYGKHYEFAFGDLEMNFTNTRMINYNPKFEGLKVSYFAKNSFASAYALSKGKKADMSFLGVEGKQGPYYLTVSNSPQGVLIVPGSEEVFLDGIQVQRGSEYTIDYSEGTITFKSLITSNTKVLVHFQYSDAFYRQNLFLNSSAWKITDHLLVTDHLIMQTDDRKNPIEQNLTPDDIRILKEAGDNQAHGKGIFQVNPGEGLYVTVNHDSTDSLTLDTEIIYQYVGPNKNGDYLLYFSYVGVGNGDYQQVAPSQYEWVGHNNGEWMPWKNLPSPQSQANYDLQFVYDRDTWKFDMEGLFTNYDQNTFSSQDDGDNTGFVGHFNFLLKPDYDKVNPELEAYYRKKTSNVKAFGVLTDAQDDYDLVQVPTADSLASDEYGTKFQLNFPNLFTPMFRYRYQSVKNTYTQNYGSFTGSLKQKWLLPETYYRIVYTKQDFQDNTLLQSIINRQDFRESHQVSIFHFGSQFQRYIYENHYLYNSKNGTLFSQDGYFVGLNKQKLYSAQVTYGNDKNSVENGTSNHWVKQKQSNTVTVNQVLNTSNHTLRLDYTHRRSQTTLEEEEDQKYDLVELHSTHNLVKHAITGTTSYQVNNLEFYPKVRKLVYIGNDLGSYDSTGVFVSNGDYNYDMVNVGKAELSTEVNTEATVNITPIEIPGIQKNSFFAKMQSETYTQINENSRSATKVPIYLMNPEYLMNQKYTIYGKQIFRQTLWYNLIPKTSLTKLKYQRERSLDNRYNENSWNSKVFWESMLRYNHLIGADWELTGEWNHELDSRYKSDIRIQRMGLDIRQRKSNQLILETDFTFSEENGQGVGLTTNYHLTGIGASESVTLFWKQNYRIFSKIDIRHNQRSGSSYLGFLPEKKAGMIILWNLSINYKMNSYTTAALDYAGNQYPNQQVIHKATMELRAEF